MQGGVAAVMMMATTMMEIWFWQRERRRSKVAVEEKKIELDSTLLTPLFRFDFFSAAKKKAFRRHGSQVRLLL